MYETIFMYSNKIEKNMLGWCEKYRFLSLTCCFREGPIHFGNYLDHPEETVFF